MACATTLLSDLDGTAAPSPKTGDHMRAVRL